MKPIKHFFFVCIAFMMAHPVSGQNRADSLQRVFEDPGKEDSIRFKAGYDYMITFFRTDLDSARLVGELLLAFSQQAGNDAWVAQSYRSIGNTFAIQGKFEQAQAYFFDSHQILLELGDELSLMTTFNNIGTVYYELGNYTQAQEYLLESLLLAEKLENDVGASRALNNLGNVHNDLKNNEIALDYYTKSLTTRERLGDRRRLPNAYNNIGLVYANMGKREEAIDNLSQSAKIARELGDEVSESRAYSNLGIEYTKLGQYNTALDYFEQSIQIKTRINDQDGLASAYLYRGQSYLTMKRYAQANTDCMLSLRMTRASGAQNWEKESCGCISQAQEGLGNYRIALDYHQQYLALKDSLFNKEKTQEITRAEMNYEFEKQQLADSIAFHRQQTAQQVAFEQEINRQQNKFYIVLLVALATIGFMAFLYWRYRQNLKLTHLENKLLSSEIEYKEKDLVNLAVNISNNQEWAESLAARVESLKDSSGRKRAQELEDLETEIKNKIWVDKDSEEFYKQIDALSTSFYDRLTQQFEGLTKTDIRLCSLIKLDLNTKQIAILQNIEPSSVKMSRNRLRKKLNLAPEDDLNGFLRTF